jgi:predicted ATPase
MLNENFIISLELIKDKINSTNEYPFNLPVVQYLEKIELHKNVTFFIGENGTGKSTLLEALAVQYGFNPEGGSKNFNFSTQKTHSLLSDAIRIAKGVKRPKDGYFLRAESFYNVATNIDQIQKEDGGIYGSYGGKSLHEQSHGESFFSLFLHRFFGNGIYILDEPEAALSPQRQLAFLVRMDELVKQKSQLIIATHSPIILSYPNAKVIHISENGFEEVPYKETEHYDLYKSFLNNPDYMLKKLKIE